MSQREKCEKLRMSGGEGDNLEFTPTWVVAVVCSVIVAVSFALERSLHYGGKFLKKKNQKSLFEALQKVKEGIITTINYHFISVDMMKRFLIYLKMKIGMHV